VTFRVAALAVAAAVAVLTACGGSPTSAAGSTESHLPASGDATAPAAPSPPAAVAAGYAPRQFLVAYGIQPLLDRGIDGHGVAVLLPEQAEIGPARPPAVTDIRQDVADFDSRFGLPPARIQVITTLAGPGASPWLASQEEVEDTEMVHAVAPGATIVELPYSAAAVSTPAKLAATYTTATRIAVGHADVISLSATLGEHFFTSAEVATINSALRSAASRHLTFVASSGDEGAISDLGGFGSSAPVEEVSLPASDPFVLAVGGTSLTANPVTGAYLSETAWNTLPALTSGRHSDASAGGFSHLFARPAYQDGVPGTGATRGVPDVAGDASPDTGMMLAVTAPDGTYTLMAAAGTSAATPFWAGLIALADQQAGHPLGFVNPAIYQIARGPLYHKAFHDVTTGNNTVVVNGAAITGYQAGPGWDPVTGWGTPDAQVLVPLLAR